MKTTRILKTLIGASVAIMLLSGAVSAQAQQKVRFAYIKTDTLLPFFLANTRGYFKAEGMELEIARLRRADPNKLFDLMVQLVAGGYAKQLGAEKS